MYKKYEIKMYYLKILEHFKLPFAQWDFIYDYTEQ